MKKKKRFDFVIGNPPYQEDTESTSDKPVYNYYMNAAYKLADKVELISPARFLSNAGKTPKEWNRKMLDDPNLKVLDYWSDSSEIFPGNDITGGIVITYRDISKNFGPIKQFVPQTLLYSILQKVIGINFVSLDSLIYSPESYKFTNLLHKDHHDVISRLSNGHKYDLTTNIFVKLNDIFVDNNPENDQYVGILGRENNKRTIKWILKKYINAHPNLNFYKVVVPKSNGSPALGSNLETPVIGLPELAEPGVGHNQTYLSIGNFDSREEANNCLNYIKTRFARAMLGTLKVTQDNKKGVWKNIPLQDFTANSDIDWSKSIPEIDQQLYRKYGLDEKEIEFIESHVKEME